MRYNFPYATRGQRIGLLGGSFDPAHEGHVHITKEALKRFKLDQVWWLISPKNPLKAKYPNTVSQRIKEAKLLFKSPKSCSNRFRNSTFDSVYFRYYFKT